MLDLKALLAKILKNQVQVATFSKSVTLPANGQSVIYIDISIPSGATIKAVSLGITPNANWVFSGIAGYNNTSVQVLYNNTASWAISNPYEVAVFYTI